MDSGRPSEKKIEKPETHVEINQPKINDRFNAITKFAFATSCGYQPGNPYKVNQDSYILVPNMLNTAGFHLFAVNDGHGLFGHKASQDIRAELPERLEE